MYTLCQCETYDFNYTDYSFLSDIWKIDQIKIGKNIEFTIIEKMELATVTERKFVNKPFIKIRIDKLVTWKVFKIILSA